MYITKTCVCVCVYITSKDVVSTCSAAGGKEGSTDIT